MRAPDPTSSGASPDALHGATLDGRYRVTSTLGAGGMATVYLADDERLERKVVVKLPHRSLAEQPDFVARFHREIKSLTRIEHPSVLKVLDTGSHGGLPYAVLQHLSGGSLRDKLDKAGGKLPAAEVLPWLLQVAAALDHVHERGLVHRDVKPGNVLYDDTGNVLLADFGIAKSMSASDTGITATGVTPGSPGYMAPEVMKGGALGPKYDQFSLAVMVFEALSGRLPFAGSTPIEQIGSLLNEPPADLASIVPELPPVAAEVVMRALSKDPAARFGSCTELAKSFQAALGVPTVQVFPKQFAAALRRKRWLRFGAAVAVVAAAVTVGWFARPEMPAAAPDTSPKEPATPKTSPPPKPLATGEAPWKLVTPPDGPAWVKVSELQIAEAKKLNVPVAFENPIGMRFVLIPAGSFSMGSPGDDAERYPDEEAPHPAHVAGAFYLQTCETTNRQFRTWHADHHVPNCDGAVLDDDEQPAGSERPSVGSEFARHLGTLDSRTYRLPTETEWEWACRAGTATPRYWGTDVLSVSRYENVTDRAAQRRWTKWAITDVDDGFEAAAPVGRFLPNPWGLHDMLGNVAEWCLAADGNGVGVAEVARGGAWLAHAGGARCTFRTPQGGNLGGQMHVGFRLAAELPPRPTVEIADPAGAAAVDEGLVSVRGTASAAATIRVNGVTGDVKDGKFDVAITLPPGEQEIEVVAGTLSAIRKVKVTAVPRPEAAWPGVPAWAKVSKQQIDEAKRLGVDVAFENSIGMRFVLVPAGRFWMGSPDDEPGHTMYEVLHPVTLTKAHYVGITETTNAQARRWKPSRHSTATGVELDRDEQPAVFSFVTDADALAEWLTSRNDGHVYRLPTDAEWEHACRAGTSGPFWWGPDESAMQRFANVADRAAQRIFPRWTVYDFDDGAEVSAPVASYGANPWGAFDVLGNVGEWTCDAPGMLAPGAVVDPCVRATGADRVLRGGAWLTAPHLVRASVRFTEVPDDQRAAQGVRLVADLPAR